MKPWVCVMQNGKVSDCTGSLSPSKLQLGSDGEFSLRLFVNRFWFSHTSLLTIQLTNQFLHKIKFLIFYVSECKNPFLPAFGAPLKLFSWHFFLTVLLWSSTGTSTCFVYLPSQSTPHTPPHAALYLKMKKYERWKMMKDHERNYPAREFRLWVREEAFMTHFSVFLKKKHTSCMLLLENSKLKE